MPEAEILIQFVTVQRTERPVGQRILQDGRLQRTADDNALPNATEALEKDRDLRWIDIRVLTALQIQAVKDAVVGCGFFDLPARLLINYCKEDPGTQIWTANIDGRKARVVIYDPKPHRSPEVDRLQAALAPILA